MRTDFYELYWADLSGGSTWDQVKAWVRGLLLRNPFTRVPRDVFLAWIVLWLITLTAIIFAIAAALPTDATIGPWRPWIAYRSNGFPDGRHGSWDLWSPPWAWW